MEEVMSDNHIDCCFGVVFTGWRRLGLLSFSRIAKRATRSERRSETRRRVGPSRRPAIWVGEAS